MAPGNGPRGRPPAKKRTPIDHATRLILRVCRLAGSTAILDDARAWLQAEGIHAAIRDRNTAISDQVAADYMDRHGNASWQVIASDLRRRPSCRKLQSYWHFHDCRYNKSRFVCAEPDHLAGCPLPRHWLRNGRLNQAAYSLHLFIRDIADGDLVAWVDRRLRTAARPSGSNRPARMRMALLDPLREVYGVSDKVLMVALSDLFLGAPGRRRRWLEVGGSMIAIDTLVHNFLHRTGILRRFRADHAYGIRCYRPGGCAEIIEAVAQRINARQFNRRFPGRFRGSFSMRSGDIAASRVSTSATATRLMIESVAAIKHARYTVYVIVNAE